MELRIAVVQGMAAEKMGIKTFINILT